MYKYSLIDTIESVSIEKLETSIDLNAALKKGIDSTQSRYIFIVKDFVVLPLNIERYLAESIILAEQVYGEDWYCISNEGIRVFHETESNYKLERFARIKEITTGIHFKTQDQIPVVNVGGNCLLINLSAHKELLKIPQTIQHAVKDAYSMGKISLLDSRLYSAYNVDGKVLIQEDLSLQSSIIELSKNSEETSTVIREYSKKKKLYIIARLVGGNEDHLHNRRIESLQKAIKKYTGKDEITIFISFNKITREKADLILKQYRESYPEITFEYSFIDDVEGEDQRLKTIRHSLSVIPENESAYVFFLDGDDYIENDNIFNECLPLLVPHALLIGNSHVYAEQWKNEELLESKLSHSYVADQYYKNLLSGNYVPISSVIYPLNILKQSFQTHSFGGILSEDYAMLMSCITQLNVWTYPINLSAISVRETNTVLRKDEKKWLQHESTFLTELINSNGGLVPHIMFDFINSLGNTAKIVPEWEKALKEYNRLETFKATMDLSKTLSENATLEETMEMHGKLTHAMGLNYEQTEQMRELFTKAYKLNHLTRKNLLKKLTGFGNK